MFTLFLFDRAFFRYCNNYAEECLRLFQRIPWDGEHIIRHTDKKFVKSIWLKKVIISLKNIFGKKCDIGKKVKNIIEKAICILKLI